MKAAPTAAATRADLTSWPCNGEGFRRPSGSAVCESPNEVTLTRVEIAVVLFALDVVEQAQVPPADAATVRRAVRLLTRKLWPEFGDLLGEDE
jgi:hypothetical protein